MIRFLVYICVFLFGTATNAELSFAAESNNRAQIGLPVLEVWRFECGVADETGLAYARVFVRHLGDGQVDGIYMQVSFWTAYQQRIGYAASAIERTEVRGGSGLAEVLGPSHPNFDSCKIDYFENGDGERLPWRHRGED